MVEHFILASDSAKKRNPHFVHAHHYLIPIAFGKKRFGFCGGPHFLCLTPPDLHQFHDEISN